MKEVRRTKVEQIKRIIIALSFFILPPFTQIRNPALNEKGSVGEHSTMSETWFGNISAGLQERCGEIPCRDHIRLNPELCDNSGTTPPASGDAVARRQS
jgi:hypothetical protein